MVRDVHSVSLALWSCLSWFWIFLHLFCVGDWRSDETRTRKMVGHLKNQSLRSPMDPHPPEISPSPAPGPAMSYHNWDVWMFLHRSSGPEPRTGCRSFTRNFVGKIDCERIDRMKFQAVRKADHETDKEAFAGKLIPARCSKTPLKVRKKFSSIHNLVPLSNKEVKCTEDAANRSFIPY